MIGLNLVVTTYKRVTPINYYNLNVFMDVEPLPKVTFLPAPLTELVIKNWTGDVIDYEKNNQVSQLLVTL